MNQQSQHGRLESIGLNGYTQQQLDIMKAVTKTVFEMAGKSGVTEGEIIEIVRLAELPEEAERRFLVKLGMALGFYFASGKAITSMHKTEGGGFREAA